MRTGTRGHARRLYCRTVSALAFRAPRVHLSPWLAVGWRQLPKNDSALFRAACERARATKSVNVESEKLKEARQDALKETLKGLLNMDRQPLSLGAENLHPNRQESPGFADRPVSPLRCTTGLPVRRRQSSMLRSREMSDVALPSRRRRSSLLGALGDSMSLGSFHRMEAIEVNPEENKAPWFSNHAETAMEKCRGLREGKGRDPIRFPATDAVFTSGPGNMLWVRRRWSAQQWRRCLVNVYAESEIGPVLALTPFDRRMRLNHGRLVTSALRSSTARPRAGSVYVRSRRKNGKSKASEIFPFILRTDGAVFELAAETIALRNEWMEKLYEVTVDDRGS